MAYQGDDDDDLPEAPPLQMITESFSQISVVQENDKQNNNKTK